MMQEQFDALTPPAKAGPYSRRDFVHTTVGTGFAAAVLPALADTTIRTDSQGLVVGEVTIPVGAFRMPAYRAVPQGATRPPLVLLVSEIFGVHEYIADVARRLAKKGCMAIAPELFVRQGDAQRYGEIGKLLAEVIAKVPDRQVMGDLDACVAWARGEGADTARLGITGFCWGGRIVWLYCAHNPAVKAGVAWYGQLAGQTDALRPQHPIDVVGSLHGAVLGLYGEADNGIPPAQVRRMEQALAQGSTAARASRIVVYPGAPHAFHADYRPSYRKEAAEDGWKRCLEWLEGHGVA